MDHCKNYRNERGKHILLYYKGKKRKKFKLQEQKLYYINIMTQLPIYYDITSNILMIQLPTHCERLQKKRRKFRLQEQKLYYTYINVMT